MNEEFKEKLKSNSIKEFCTRNGILELQVFGSILREDFSDNSDIDFLVTFNNASKHTLFDIVRMKMELENIVGRPVDLVHKNVIQKSKNYIRRDSILNNSVIIYAA